MNNEEAIEYLNYHYLVFSKEEIDKHNEVIYMAISALKNQAISENPSDKEYKLGYFQALNDYKKFSEDYNSCKHDCGAYGSCIDCFIKKVKAEEKRSCPACGEKFEGYPNECPSCGLSIVWESKNERKRNSKGKG